jgi:hypothetical protein
MRGKHKMGEWEKLQKRVFFVSVGVAGAVSATVAGLAAATDLSPLLTALLAGLLSSVLGTLVFAVGLRLVGNNKLYENWRISSMLL